MSFPLLLSFILAPLVFLSLSCFFGMKGNKIEHHPYDVLSYFPYELYQSSKGVYFAMARVMEGFFLLSVLALPVYLLSSAGIYQTSSYLSFLIGIFAFSVLSSAAFLFLTIVPLPQVRLHLGLYFLHGAFAITSASMEGFLLLAIGKNMPEKQTALSVFATLLFAVSFAIMLLWVNPKLLSFAKMDKEVGPDGNIILKRPKPFVLAFSEWLTVFLQVFGLSLAAIAFYLI